MTTPRPTVWLNCATSVDGRLAYAGGRTARLSGPEDLERVHRLRAQVRAIVVGVGTVLADDPALTVQWERLREPPRAGPTRVVLDSTGRTPDGARILDGRAPTIVAVSSRCRRRFPSTAETVVCGAERVEIPQLWAELLARDLTPVLVEGGGEVLASVLRSGAFDRWTVYVAPLVIGGRTAPSLAGGIESRDPGGSIPLENVAADRLGAGTLLTYVPRPLHP